MSDRIPDLIDEQESATLLARQSEILDRTQLEIPGSGFSQDPALQLHHDAITMAAETESYLRECYGHLADTRAEAGRHGKQLLRLIDFQTQFRAHHLDKLDRLNPA